MAQHAWNPRPHKKKTMWQRVRIDSKTDKNQRQMNMDNKTDTIADSLTVASESSLENINAMSTERIAINQATEEIPTEIARVPA
ncbi:hypothetical protein Dimus_037793, partial [Dionaea muscipula]